MNHRILPFLRSTLVAGIFALGLSHCAGRAAQSEGLDPSTLPSELRDDYAIFAQRCSKCHSLARPLNSGITDENFWTMYVARMRRQPASGITHEDAAPILRFLYHYSAEQKRKHDQPPTPSASPRAPVSVKPDEVRRF
jgi:hypothetical protein